MGAWPKEEQDQKDKLDAEENERRKHVWWAYVPGRKWAGDYDVDRIIALLEQQKFKEAIEYMRLYLFSYERQDEVFESFTKVLMNISK